MKKKLTYTVNISAHGLHPLNTQQTYENTDAKSYYSYHVPEQIKNTIENGVLFIV